MPKLRCVVCCGAPASGKSTWATKAIHELPGDWVRVNRDDFRAMFNGGDPWCHYGTPREKAIEVMTVNLRNEAVRLALGQGLNVVLDECNIRSRAFYDVQNLVEEMSDWSSVSATDPVCYEVEEKAFYISLEEAMERNARRSVSVESKVVEDIWTALGGVDFQLYKPKTFSGVQSD